MDITPFVPQNAHVVNGYSTSGFTVSGKQRQGSILITQDECREISLRPEALFEFDEIEALLMPYRGNVEIVLIGTGSKYSLLPKGLVEKITRHFNCQLEAMATGSACRTYNILMAEGRLVVAILLTDDV